MPVILVRHFVRHYHGQPVLAVDHFEQARGDEDVSARQDEGIGRRILDEIQTETELGTGRIAQPFAKLLQVSLDFGLEAGSFICR